MTRRTSRVSSPRCVPLPAGLVLVLLTFLSACSGTDSADGSTVGSPDGLASDGLAPDVASADVPPQADGTDGSGDTGEPLPDADEVPDVSDASAPPEPLVRVCILPALDGGAESCGEPWILDVGEVAVGTQATRSFRIENASDVPVSLDAITPSDPFPMQWLLLDDIGGKEPVATPAELAPSASLFVTVDLLPGAPPGPVVGTLVVALSSDGIPYAPRTVSVQATVLGCPAGTGSCNDDWSDGCESDVLASAENCGACDKPCRFEHGKAECILGACVLHGCQGGYFGPTCAPCAGTDDGGTCDHHGTCDDGPLGSGTCTCDGGWEGPDCAADIDECATLAADCHPVATCTNTPGGYECACPAGYVGDGVTCLGTLGTPCGADADCVDVCKAGQCASSGKPGSACSLDTDCVVPPCTDLDGNGTPETCGAPNGAECTDAQTCASLVCGPVAGGASVCGACPVGAACSGRPDASGVCTGVCVAQHQEMTCRGTVVAGLCHGLVAPSDHSVVRTIGQLTLTPASAPNGVHAVGDTVPLQLVLHNGSANAISATVTYQVSPTWTLEAPSVADGGTLMVAAGASATLSATLTAGTPNLLDGTTSAVWLVFELSSGTTFVYEVPGLIGFQPGPATTSCGKMAFPATWCPGDNCGSNDAYNNAVCCDGVFYPGSSCCTTADCFGPGAVCSDGYCVSQVPQFGSANTLPMGHQRFLVVFSDFVEVAPPPATCLDRADELAESQHLVGVEAWLDAMIAKRTGRPEKQLHVQWTVLGGFQSSDFVFDDQYGFYAYQASLETWLVGQGCIDGFADYDKVIVISPKIDISFGGQAFPEGHVAMRTHHSPYLMTHELLHTYGARDTYLNIGNRFQYAADLMGNYLQPTPVPDDGVAWTEVGLGDLQGDGVLDIYQVPHYPEAIALEAASAVITAKGTVEVTAKLSLMEAGVAYPFALDAGGISFPEQGLQIANWYKANDQMVVVSMPVDSLTLLAQKGVLVMQVVTTHLFTNAQFERVPLTFSEAVEVPIVGAP